MPRFKSRGSNNHVLGNSRAGPKHGASRHPRDTPRSGSHRTSSAREIQEERCIDVNRPTQSMRTHVFAARCDIRTFNACTAINRAEDNRSTMDLRREVLISPTLGRGSDKDMLLSTPCLHVQKRLQCPTLCQKPAYIGHVLDMLHMEGFTDAVG